MIYVFDTSSFRVLGNYFPQSFPSFWRNFNDAVSSGKIISVREVYNELDNQVNVKPHVIDWIHANRNIFLAPNDDETKFVSEIFTVPHFRQIVTRISQLRGRYVADPFVIAAAKVISGCVVTEESDNKPNAARIPNICDHFNINCMTLEEFMQSEDWRF
ncbi:MAG: DUF4411 family protein [Chloroflexi bacterium]|nr:DUF4411 family protein [Chloroflexota bacterium]